MSRQRFVILLVAALLAISGALYLSTERSLPRDPQGMPLMPALAHELNTVTALAIRRGGANPSVTVHQHGQQWTVAERGDYPADVAKLRKLLLALSDSKIIEEKTSSAANFRLIGVEDPSSPAATGAQITIDALDGKHSVIIGKPAGGGKFARRGGEHTSYLVEPAISFETEPRFWIDSRLIDIAVAKIQSIEVHPPAGPPYSIRRVSPGDGNFALDAVPRGRKSLEPRSLAPSPSTYGGITAEDVAAASDVDFSKAAVAIVTMTDGTVITLTGAASGDKRWIQLKSSTDSALSAKAQGRAFEIASYRYDAIFRPLEQMLEPKPSPPDAKKPAAASRP
jgi:hypothetical protein